MSILAILEQREGAWNRASWEALAAARGIGRDTGRPVAAAVAGMNIAALAQEAARNPLARVYAVEHPDLAVYTADAYAAAVEALVRQARPWLVLFPHTYQVRDFAPKVAARFGASLVSDASGHRVADGALCLIRQIYQGRLNAEVVFRGKPPYFCSVQSGAYRAEESAGGAAEVVTFVPAIEPGSIRCKPSAPFRESQQEIDLTAAAKIVAAGRGIQEKDHLPLIEKLAQALGAEVAASRPVCDNGWLPMERQVGSSGQTVTPKLYVAVGISGAIQHLVGMKGSKTIVAINKDPSAPIFEVADYGIVGDLFEVVPALLAELEKVKP